MFDYDTLRLIWWALLGILLIGIAVMDGFDMGAAILLPFVGKTDIERRIVLNTVGPVWEGNQVWLILGGGAIFAAWPTLYAVAFSGFYLAMLLLLTALILRPVGFKFRSKIHNARWRTTWDWALFAGGLVPALVFGVAFGNVLQGVPFSFDDTMRMNYEGTLVGLFNPFALLCGLVSVAMMTMHGAAYLACKTEGAVRQRAAAIGHVATLALVALFCAGGAWAMQIDGYSIGAVAANGPSTPLSQTVVRDAGGLFANYSRHAWTMAVPLLAVVAAICSGYMAESGRHPVASFIASGVAVACVIATAGLSLFPFLLPSSLDPNASLTVWNASSSEMTLGVMLFVTAIFLPIILAYTAWAYRVLRGPVTAETIERAHTAY